MDKRTKAALGTVAATVAFIAMAVGLNYLDSFRKRHVLHMVAPTDRSARVTLDGEVIATIPPGAHLELNMRHGNHTLVLADPAHPSDALTVTDNEDSNRVIPVAKDQCFVTFDISRSHYDNVRDERAETPMLVQKYTDSSPFLAPTLPETYFTVKDLPEKTTSRVLITRPVGCKALSLSDKNLSTLILMLNAPTMQVDAPRR